MGWFWAGSSPLPPHPIPTDASVAPSRCPVMHEQTEFSTYSDLEACPYAPPLPPSTNPTLSISRPSESSAYSLNPLNYMFSDISQKQQPSQVQRLPTERTISSIPKGTEAGNWEYPSPQQMYNALIRKGYLDTPEDGMEAMVDVHNFLNEGAWAEIVEWERRFSSGLIAGWQNCARGEQGSLAGADLGSGEDEDVPQPKLARFQGRPKDMTPKAAWLQFMARIFPNTYENKPPFDRHDWFVQRHDRTGETREVRYVIDYYEAPPEPTGEPVFFLDVRPAIDGPTAAAERLMRWYGDFWWRASGGRAREARNQL